jgi:putative transposase
MERIPPSQRVRQQVAQLLKGGLQEESSPISRLVQVAVQMVLQEVLEQEVSDHLGRGRNQRRQPGAEHRGYRNGYEPGRMRTAEGEIEVAVPQVRDGAAPYRSKLMAFLAGHSEVLERLAVEMYARGLSTRDVEDALREATGEPLLSRTGVSELTETLWDQYQAFSQRDLSGLEVEYLFLDAVYESLRLQGGGKEGLLCAWAICRDGRKVMLHLALGNKESYANWLEFLRDMARRGLPDPVLGTTDGAPGVIRAFGEVFPHSLRQRCLAHRMRNITDKLPDYARADVKAELDAAYYAANQDMAKRIGVDLVAKYEADFPSALKSFREDFDAGIAYLRCPVVHHQRIRTTNLLERSFLEERRRTKVIPRFFSERSCLKLAFAALWRASAHWRKVKMTDLEIRRLRQLRHELNLPDYEPTHSEGQTRSIAA